MNYRQQVARAITQARVGAGISQVELARRLGIEQPMISDWEAGLHSPRIKSLERIAKACGRVLVVRFDETEK